MGLPNKLPCFLARPAAQIPVLNMLCRHPLRVLVNSCLCTCLLYVQAEFCDFTDSFPELSPLYTYPKQLLAYEVAAPPVIDGHLEDEAWAEVAWSDDFVDISQHAPPRFQTQVKVRWDMEYLYVAARLVEPNTWANITRHNEAS